MEDRSVPAVVFTDTYTWNEATVTVTVDDAAPGYPGLYHWNYHVHNDSFGSGMEAFAVPLDTPGMATNLGSSVGWSGSPGGFLGNPALVSWQGAPRGIGQAADFWFTTVPRDIGLTNGFIANPGLTQFPADLLAFPVNAAPVPFHLMPRPLYVTTTEDAASKYTSLRQAITKINLGETDRSQLVTEIKFAQTMTGQTITLNSQLPRIDEKMSILGENRNVTVTRDAAKGNFRLFKVGDSELTPLPDVTISNLTLKGGGGTAGMNPVTDGGAILSYANLTLVGCTIRDNSAFFGGGVDADGGTLYITNCQIFDNEAAFGGGVYIYEHVTSADITGGSIHDNEASGSGGGIFIAGGANVPILLSGVHIYLNTAAGLGGGGGVFVFNNQEDGGSPQLTITGNTLIEYNGATEEGSKGGGCTSVPGRSGSPGPTSPTTPRNSVAACTSSPARQSSQSP